MIATKEAVGFLTLGTEDTTKLAGRSSFEVKTGTVTAVKPTKESKKRKTFSLGFHENLSQKGAYSAVTIKTSLGQIGVCVDLTEDEVLDMFDVSSVIVRKTIVPCLVNLMLQMKTNLIVMHTSFFALLQQQIRFFVMLRLQLVCRN